MDSDSKKKMAGFVSALGSVAESAHIFYSTMIKAGATEPEAIAGMQSFVSSMILSANQKNRQGGDDDE